MNSAETPPLSAGLSAPFSSQLTAAGDHSTSPLELDSPQSPINELTFQFWSKIQSVAANSRSTDWTSSHRMLLVKIIYTVIVNLRSSA